MIIKWSDKQPAHRHIKRMAQFLAFLARFGRITHLLIKYILEPLVKKEETKYNSWIRQILIFIGGSCLKPSDYPAAIPLTNALVDYFRRVTQYKK